MGIFGRASGRFSAADIDQMKDGSDVYDGYYNQTSPGHAMKYNKYEDFTGAFKHEYERGWGFLAEAEKADDAKTRDMYRQQANLAFGRAAHIIGDYRSHYMRKEDTGWEAHIKSRGDSRTNPDSPYNQPWLFENARNATEYLGWLHKNDVRKIEGYMIDRLFPLEWENS